MLTKRSTENILDILAKLGGLLRGVTAGLGMFVMFFADGIITTVIANKFYTWVRPDSFDNINGIKKFSSKKVKSKSSLEEEPVALQKYMDLRKFIFFCCPCKKKPGWYTDYLKELGEIHEDVNDSLDLITLLRRLRAHGFILSALMD